MIPLIAIGILLGPPDSLRYRPEDIDSLPAAQVRLERGGRLIIELPPLDVPPEGTVRTPVYRVPISRSISLYGFTIEVVDDAGRILPPDRLHHVVFTDPNRRELFLPLALPIFAASKESPRPRLPKNRVGLLLSASTRYLVAAMFENPDPVPKRMVVRLVLSFVRPGRIVPAVQAYPWTLDVTYPLGKAGGRHDFDLPPGRSSFSWQASPQIAGTIVAMGGHAHDYATAIQLEDVTTGKMIFRQEPVRDDAGRLVRILPVRFASWYRAGVHITPIHTYRVTVFYDNPTGECIPFGGMGSVAGLFIPDENTAWPPLDPGNSIYRAQINNLLSNMSGLEMTGTRRHSH
jgi:hypothetical protein